MMPRTKRPFRRREFQQAFLTLAREHDTVAADLRTFEALARREGRLFDGARHEPLLRTWVTELESERILVPADQGLSTYRLNPELIVGETTVERFGRLPDDTVRWPMAFLGR